MEERATYDVAFGVVQRRGGAYNVGRTLHGLRNGAWITAWIVLYFLCVNVFGNPIAFVGILLLLAASVWIWVVTERRRLESPDTQAAGDHATDIASERPGEPS